MEVMDYAVTYGLTAIGLCLMLGLFTRSASLGGAAFLFSVVLSQPSWPTIYPPPPVVAGHALIIDKNFVEMVALLLMATTVVGRWGGLDFFVHNVLTKNFIKKDVDEKKRTTQKKGRDDEREPTSTRRGTSQLPGRDGRRHVTAGISEE